MRRALPSRFWHSLYGLRFKSTANALLMLQGLFCVPHARAQSSPSTLKTLATFSCDSATKTCPQGTSPTSLIQSANGSFYGTTEFGGPGGAGTVFRLSPTGALTTIYSFTGSAFTGGPKGANPTSLVEGNDGFLYGTTAAGGANNQGVVFKLSKTGTIQVLHSFNPSSGEGNQPFNLVLANDGNFYGCTAESFPATLFRVSPSGSFQTLHTFQVNVDGPQCIGMVLGSDGNMYGTTAGAQGFPTVLFRLTPSGQVTDIHQWRYSQFPLSSPTQTSEGNLWGVLSHAVGVAQPVMFSIGLSGADYQETPLFYSNSALGFVNFMTQASDGNFWGTFIEGNGSVVSFTASGVLNQQISSSSFTGDVGPIFLVQAANGALLGFSNSFLDNVSSEVFAISPSLPPPAPALSSFGPASGIAGSKVKIHGVHLVGTSAVKFNGVSATFHVLNTGNISATVPLGASSGPITIINRGGEAVSTTDYTVE